MRRSEHRCSNFSWMAGEGTRRATRAICATAVALYALCTTAGCVGHDGGPPEGTDAAVPSARLSVLLEASGPSEGEIALTEARVGISELRANSDRGGDLEPRMQEVGEAELRAGTTIDFGTVPPATYGRVTMRLEEGDWGPGLALQLTSPDGSVRVVLREPVDVDARCAAPVLVAPGSSATLDLRLDVDAVWEALPEHPTDGEDVEVDDETDPEAADDVQVVLRDAWTLDCGEAETSGATEALDTDGASTE